MAELNGKHIIRSLQKRWISTIVIAAMLWAAGIALLLFYPPAHHKRVGCLGGALFSSCLFFFLY